MEKVLSRKGRANISEKYLRVMCQTPSLEDCRKCKLLPIVTPEGEKSSRIFANAAGCTVNQAVCDRASRPVIAQIPSSGPRAMLASAMFHP